MRKDNYSVLETLIEADFQDGGLHDRVLFLYLCLVCDILAKEKAQWLCYLFSRNFIDNF